MTVGELLRALAPACRRSTQSPLSERRRALDAPCTGVTHDSRRAAPGAVFVALRGLKADGAAFAPQAIAAARRPSSPKQPRPPASACRGSSSATRASRWRCWRPSSSATRAARCSVVGITGTNGKTTTSYLVSAIFEAAGITCGLMGTVTYRIGDRAFDATRTTPEAPDVQALHAPDGGRPDAARA